jgi:hypothetical protein
MPRQALKVFSILNPPPLVPPPRNNQLQGLPTKILQYIASTLLPPASAAALALSSRFILAKPGTGYFTQLNKGSPLPPVTHPNKSDDTRPKLSQPQQELEDFLILLDRDMTATIYCYYCRKIHDPMKTLRPSLGESWNHPPSWNSPSGKNLRACAEWELNIGMHERRHANFSFLCKDKILAYHYHVHSNFTFSHIQMIMKASRLGIDYSALLQKLSTTCTYYNDYYSHQTSFTDQITTYARVVSGCLLLRTVHWLLFEWGGKFGWPVRPRVCPHRYALDRDLPSPFIAMPVPGAYGPMSIFRYGAGIELKRCHICATEYEMDGAECGRGLFVLRINVWQDIGDCPSELWGPSKCKHAREVLGSLPHSTASPPWNVKARFEYSCSEAQKLQKLMIGTKLELPKHLYLATYKTRKSSCHRYCSSYYNVASMIYQ